MVYTPQRGFAQFQYFDQQATALAGMLANASDINLVDSAFVGPVDATVGLTAGIGVMVNPTVRSNRPGLNYDIVMPPDSAATDEQKAAVVRKQAELQRVERKIDNRLRQLHDAQTAELGTIRLVRSPACRIVWMSGALELHSFLDMEPSIRPSPSMM